MTDMDKAGLARLRAFDKTWQDRVVHDYPAQFPEEGFTFEVLGGWSGVVRELCHRVSLLPPEALEGMVWTQVKEKFGGLRAYNTGGDEVEAVVRWAEEVAERTCDVCGAPGRMRTGGWYATRCDEHDGWRGR